MAKSKDKRKQKAAYAASQPLFEALRYATLDNISQQRHLETARDTVQKLHVKLPTDSISDTVQDTHEKYMDAVVLAWRSALENYADIFHELKLVTAAEPEAGRAVKEGHEMFAKMEQMARDIFETSHAEWKISAEKERNATVSREVPKEEPTVEDEEMQDVSESEGSEGDESEAAAAQDANTGKAAKAAGNEEPVDNRPTNPILLSMLSKKRPSPDQDEAQGSSPKAAKLNDSGKASKKDSKDTSGNGATRPTVPFATLSKEGKDKYRAQKRLETRQKKREKRKQKGVVLGRGPKEKSTPERMVPEASEQGTNVDPNADYISLGATAESKPQFEDVSAEVAARLQAKEEKRKASKAAKEEKKRKRESGESLPGVEVSGKAEKPQKKRVKADEGLNEDAAREKAKKHGREGEGGDEGAQGGGRKKRKKASS